MIAGWKWLAICMSWDSGVWWIRIGIFVLMLKAPWNEPLFSERNGYVKVLKLWNGWRITL